MTPTRRSTAPQATAADAGETAPPRVLLVGTARTVRQMRHTLDAADQPLVIVGAALWQPLEAIPPGTNVKLLGSAAELPRLATEHAIDTVCVSLPMVMGGAVRQVRAACDNLGLVCRFMPTLRDQLTGRLYAHAGQIDYDRLLARPPRRLDESSIDQLLRGKTVLVTGAGGSIGSELARIIADHQPGRLILVERAENNLFEIHRRIHERRPDLDIDAVLHDVTHEARTAALCQRHRPQIIFHAAAHKHVPMMEDHPRQAVENNFFGTKSIADAAHAADAERFVMISSDKAVNPSNVMGATKRLAELYIQTLNAQSDTAYTMVRFGNVLGSACSVLPIWTSQLAEGLPLTVTDERMTRYFMTIPEAAALVIQAAALEEAAGQVMLLDMGQPIRIVDLARRFIEQHGLVVDHDVKIVVTGARPGEKLHEELAYGSEEMLATQHESIHIWRSDPLDARRMAQAVTRFTALRHSDDRDAILQALRDAIPEMTQPPAG